MSKVNKDEVRVDNIKTHMSIIDATIKSLDVQIGQIALLINATKKGKFSNDTKINPKE